MLYDQKWWQLDRGFSLAAAGQLSWLHYRCAMLHPEAKREAAKQWLKKSVKEFSEFVYSQDPKMSGESLLGRAMAEKELGERDAAIGDLQRRARARQGFAALLAGALGAGRRQIERRRR